MNIDLRRHKDLIAELDSLFPKPLFSMNESIDSVRWKSGERAVVEYLLRELQHQEEEGSTQGMEVFRPTNTDHV